MSVSRLIALTFIPAFLLALTPVGGWTGLTILTNGFSLIDTMFHEVGHTIFSWLFGYPTLPSFDLQHGGGMSYYFGRVWLFQLLGFMGAGYLCYLAYNRSNVLFYPALVVTGLYILSGLTEFHHSIIDFMGHGFSIITGSYFILRALFNATEKRFLEKEISAFLGYFIIFSNMKMCWKLIFDLSYQQEYWNQKGFHGFGDFSKIADYMWFTSETPVAWFCLLICAGFLILPHVLYFRSLQHHSVSDR